MVGLLLRMKLRLQELHVNVPVRRHHAMPAIMHVVVQVVQDAAASPQAIHPFPGPACPAACTPAPPRPPPGTRLSDRTSCPCCLSAAAPASAQSSASSIFASIGALSGKPRILRIVRRKLVRIPRRRSQVCNRLAVVAMAQRRSALTSAARNHRRKALIVRARPRHRLAQPRDAMNGHALRIDALVRFEVVLEPGSSPTPTRQSIPTHPARDRPRPSAPASCKCARIPFGNPVRYRDQRSP